MVKQGIPKPNLSLACSPSSQYPQSVPVILDCKFLGESKWSRWVIYASMAQSAVARGAGSADAGPVCMRARVHMDVCVHTSVTAF